MFELPQTDLFSEFRNFLTGVDFCISTLRARRSRRPVLLDISLPPSQLEDGQVDVMKRTLRRYCDHRISYNRRERRAVRFDGLAAWRIGLPIALLGVLVMMWAAQIDEDNEVGRLIVDHFGFVLAWLGFWYPLDQFFFYPLSYGRENRALAQLREADVTIRPFVAPTLTTPS